MEARECLQLLLFTLTGVVLPSLDTPLDLLLSLRALQGDQWGCGAALLLPVFLNMIFTLYAWARTEEKHPLSVFLVPLLIWPQARAADWIWVAARKSKKEKDILLTRKDFDQRIGSLEPLIEALLQVFVKTAIIGHLSTVDSGSVHSLQTLFGPSFAPSYVLSLASCAWGLASFLKTGPCAVLRQGWGLATVFSLLLCCSSSLASVAMKALVLWALLAGTEGHHLLANSFLWAGCCILPQLVLALTSLSLALGRHTPATLMLYPTLLVSSLFTPYTYSTPGPPGQLALSPGWSCANLVASLCGGAAVVALAPYFNPRATVRLLLCVALLLALTLASSTLFLAAVQWPGSTCWSKLFPVDRTVLHLAGGPGGEHIRGPGEDRQENPGGPRGDRQEQEARFLPLTTQQRRTLGAS